MNILKLYNAIMNDHLTIALATSVNQQPNVRIVNFIYKEEVPNCLYFETFKENQKVIEFAANDKVAITSIPNHIQGHVKIPIAKVVKSQLTVEDLAQAFISKIPDYAEIIEQASDALAIYELHFDKVTIVEDFRRIHALEF